MPCNRARDGAHQTPPAGMGQEQSGVPPHLHVALHSGRGPRADGVVRRASAGSASPENAARLMEEFRTGRARVARRRPVPTIVFHPEGDAVIPFDEGRRSPPLSAERPSSRCRAAIICCSNRSPHGTCCCASSANSSDGRSSETDRPLELTYDLVLDSGEIQKHFRTVTGLFSWSVPNTGFVGTRAFHLMTRQEAHHEYASTGPREWNNRPRVA